MQLIFKFGRVSLDDVISDYDVDVLHQATMKVLSPFGLKGSKEFSALALDVYPYFQLHILVYANAIHIYLWLLDDLVDKPETLPQLRDQLLQESLASLTDPSAAQHPVVKLGVYLLSKVLDPLLRSALVKELQRYYQGIRQHLDSVDKGILSVEEYLQIRLLDGAGFVALLLTCLDISDFTPFHQYLISSEGKEYSKLANLNICYVNDLYSYHKDSREGSNFNVVMSLMTEHDLDTSTALSNIITASEETYDKLKQGSSSDVGQLVVERFVRWCEGSLRWHAAAERYRAAD